MPRVRDRMLTFFALSYLISIFAHLKLCLAAANHNFKWAKITHNCLIWDQSIVTFDVQTHILLPIAAIWSAHKIQ